MLSGALWPVRPKPLADEILSSWLVRVAAGHGMKLESFVAAVWPCRSIWNRDIDRLGPEEVITEMALRTGTDPERARATALVSLESVVFEQLHLGGETSLVLPIGIYHRTRTLYGQQCCLQCLADGPITYYRRAWRLAFITVCTTHAVALVDRCPRCGAPIVFHRSELGSRSAVDASIRNFCWNCERRYPLLSRRVPKNSTIYRATAELEQVVTLGYAELALTPIYSHLYFAGFRALMALCAWGAVASDLRDLLSAKLTLDADCVANVATNVVEHLPVDDRARLVAFAWLLLRDWPNSFTTTCQNVGLLGSAFSKAAAPSPYWLAVVVQSDFNYARYTPSVQELRLAIRYMRHQGMTVTQTTVAALTGYREWHRKRKLDYLLSE